MFHNHTLYKQTLVNTSLHLVFSYKKQTCCSEIFFYSVKYSTLLEDLPSLACKKNRFLFVFFFFLHFLLHRFLSHSSIRKAQ